MIINILYKYIYIKKLSNPIFLFLFSYYCLSLSSELFPVSSSPFYFVILYIVFKFSTLRQGSRELLMLTFSLNYSDSSLSNLIINF